MKLMAWQLWRTAWAWSAASAAASAWAESLLNFCQSTVQSPAAAASRSCCTTLPSLAASSAVGVQSQLT